MPQSDETIMVSEKDSQSPMKGSLLIPSIALGYVPLVIFLLSLSTDGFGLFLYSGVFLVLLLPIYAVYLLQITRQRRENGTLTTFVGIFYIISFLVPLFWLLMYAWFVTNFNGIV